MTGYDEYQMQMDEHDILGAYRYRCEGADGRKLFMIRDSFADAMDDYVASRFNESCMVHYQSYLPEVLITEKPDIFVYELVERRINNLLTFDLNSPMAGVTAYQ